MQKALIAQVLHRSATLARLGVVSVLAATALPLALTLATPSPVLAQGVQTAIPSESLTVHIGKATPIRLPRAAQDVLVSEPSIVDTVLRTARQPVLFGMKIGQANVLFFDAAGNPMRSLEVRVEHDVRMLERMVREQFPSSDIRVESVLGEIILSGTSPSSAEAAAIGGLAERFRKASNEAQAGSGGAQSGGGGGGGGLTSMMGGEGGGDDGADGVVNRINVTNEEQIMLRVRVAEVSRDVIKQLGIDWNAGLQASTLTSSVGFSGATLKGFLQGWEVTDLVDQDGNVIDADGNGVQDIIYNQRRPIQVGSQTLDSFIKALEQHSMVRTLAEPSLTAVSGESASFLAGGEFPIPAVRDRDGIGIEWKKFGVGLDFTPVVIGEGRISMKIATEVSDLSDNGAVTIDGLTIPALSVRRASTTLELASGGTIMMAGLIEQTTRRLSNGLPGLRQVPVLGQLFRSEEFENNETELVVLVTPFVVKQGRESDFTLPTDGFAPASDSDMYLLGRLYDMYGAGPQDTAEAQKALKAPLGFILE
ncbi:MAG: type II and III secretion system protein family protein [Neomegalonema sp.]|nr:type II and III secretion system protein family protein [Neomegalonema sp.]